MACCETNDRRTPKTLDQPKVHIHIHTPDLKASTAFYTQFFGEAPVKALADYTKFLPSWAPVNLALSAAPNGGGSVVSHLGIQLPHPAMVQRELHRVKSSGLAVREEMGVDCCHANQDKFWVVDPVGIEWEVYYLNFDLKSDSQPKASATQCCARD